ncbi:MAG: YdjY domain-containing protein [Planctomycetota bacterium]
MIHSMHRGRRRLVPALILVLFAVGVWARGAGGAAAPDPENNVPSRRGARLYVKEKRIEVDGKVCLSEGPIELLACARGGKDYESVLSLNVTPSDLHMFMLMIGLKPGPPGVGPRHQGDPERVPVGDPVLLHVEFKTDGGPKTYRAEDVCWNEIDKRTMRHTRWVFVGSQFVEGPGGKKVFWANREKSIVTVFRDPFTVIDLPLELSSNDEAYVVNTKVVPPVGTECTLIIRPGERPEPPPTNPSGGNILHLDVTGGGRVLVDGNDPMDLVEALQRNRGKAPKDSFRMTIDHGAPPAAVVRAFAAVHAAGVRVESVKTVREKSNDPDGLTVVLAGDEIRVDGDRVRAEHMSRLWQKVKGKGLAVRIRPGAGPPQVVRALTPLKGQDDLVLRVRWERGPIRRRSDVAPPPISEVRVLIGVNEEQPGAAPQFTLVLPGRGVRKSGDFAWLKTRLAEIAKEEERVTEDAPVVIQPAGRTLYKWVVQTLATCRGLGWEQVNFAPPDEGGG